MGVRGWSDGWSGCEAVERGLWREEWESVTVRQEDLKVLAIVAINTE